MSNRVLLWFKRDLRIADHPALVVASEGVVLPVYIVEPEYWRLPDTSARQWSFTAECLEDLRGDLAGLGAPLVVRVGDAVDCLRSLIKAHKITQIVSHEETGNLWTFGRDRRVAAMLRALGVEWMELPQSGVVRRLKGRDGWAGLRDGFVQAGALEAVALQGIAGVEPGPIPSARHLRLAEDRCPHRQIGGRAIGLAVLDSFLNVRGAGYRAAMASPVAGERACSRLSPYLAAGALSGREVSVRTAARQGEKAGGGWGGSLSAFQSRLAWRDHFMQKLEDEPALEARCLHGAYEGVRPLVPDALRLRAWETGETGLPFVDACMRYLNATGWLNFRMRAMLMSVASYHLWLDWRASGPHLARMFTDYEPGIHWSQCQMQSGVTGINTVRMYNPVKQGLEQDPLGIFTRAWVPELAGVPDGFLQEPWKWPGAQGVLGRRYPEPVVDVVASAKAARQAVWDVRNRPGFGGEAAAVVQKHANRADERFASDRGANDRARRVRGAVASAQLGFEF